MATTRTAEEKTGKEIEVYPAAELVSAVNRMLKEIIPIKVAMVSAESGDVVFTVTLNDLGINRQIFYSHPFFTSHVFINLFGEMLVRGNIELLSQRVMDKNYDSFVKTYNHRDFGLRSKGDILIIQFHASLIYRLLNELISREIADEVSKVIIASPKKVKRTEENPGITTYADEKNNLRLVVTKCSEVRIAFQQAIESILNYYKIKGKEVFINDNIYDYQIQITDKSP